MQGWKTKARFRATRESLGLSQHDVADALGVQERTARRWEAPGYNDPPEDAWEWLDEMEMRFAEGVEAALDAVQERVARSVSISYYRSQDEYDSMGRDPGPYGFANAISRELMVLLEGEEIEVRLQFPEEADAALTSAIMMTRG